MRALLRGTTLLVGGHRHGRRRPATLGRSVAAAATGVLIVLYLTGCEEMVEPTPAEPPKKETTGEISITSTPSGARIFLNNSDTGRVTPYVIPDLSVGSHSIHLTLDGYSDWGPQNVPVAADQITAVYATLEPAAPEPEAPVERGLGLNRLDLQAYQSANIIRADPISLPSSVDISVDAPIPGDQGLQGSCVGWAVAYAVKTYHERVERGWPLTDDRHVMSPAYIYNQIKVPGGGAYFVDAFILLVEQGVSSWEQMPYDPLDDRTQPSTRARAEAANYKIADWGIVLRNTHGTFVEEIKRHLAAGTPVLIGIPVYPDFDSLSESNPVYDEDSGGHRGNHAVVIVGYDDRRSAFKIANSWGTDWGIGGYGWIDYDAGEWLIHTAYVTKDVVASPDNERPGAASDPSPSDSATGVAPSVMLRWTRNARTTSFDVYLGVDPQLSAVDFQGNVAQAEFTPHLAPGSQYYWRVDARGAGGITPGPVWTFTTSGMLEEPGKVANPNPADGATGVVQNPELRWDSGGHTTSYDVYLGTDPRLGANDLQQTLATRSFYPGGLRAGTRYHWRVDAKNGQGTTRGDVWTFTTVPARERDTSPVLPSVSSKTYDVGATVNEQLPAATGGNGALTYSLSPSIPGLTFEQATRTLYGTARQAGTYHMRYRVQDDDGDTDSQAFTITVQEQDDTSPVLTVVVSGPATVYEGSTATFTVTLAGGTSRAEVVVRYTTGGTATAADYTQPSGSLTIPTGQASGTIAIGTLSDAVLDRSETLVVTLTAANTAVGLAEVGSPAQAETTIVDSGSVSGSVADVSVVEGEQAVFTLNLSGWVGTAVTVNYATADGTATEVDDYQAARGVVEIPAGRTQATFTVDTVEDNISEPTAESFSVRLTGVSLPGGVILYTQQVTATIIDDDTVPDTSPVLPSVSSKTYDVGATVNERLPAATGGNGALTYSLSPSVPGLTFEQATRTLYGTPRQAGTYHMRYRVQDDDGDTDSQAFTITVVQQVQDTSPVLPSVSSKTYDVGATVNEQLPAATGGNGALTYSLSPSIPGLTFEQATRTLYGTPRQAGTYHMRYRVQDNDGDTDSQAFTITVQEQDTAPVLPPIGDTTYTQGAPILPWKLPAAVGGDGVLSYELINIPLGLSMLVDDQQLQVRSRWHIPGDSPDTFRLSGTPIEAGTYNIRYNVRDENGDTDRKSFTITVQYSAQPRAVSKGKIYWTRSSSRQNEGSIMSANLDGSEVTTVYYRAPVRAPYGRPGDGPGGSYIWSPQGIAISGTKLYWVDGSNVGVRRSNLDGTGVERLVFGGTYPYGIAISGGKIYWTDEGNVQRANLDGTGIETVYWSSTRLVGIAVSGDKIYWTSGSGSVAIRRANLDGTSVETLVDGIAYGIAISVDKMYWTSGAGSIQRANLDGTSVETLVSGLRDVVFHVKSRVDSQIISERGAKRFRHCPHIGASLHGERMVRITGGRG